MPSVSDLLKTKADTVKRPPRFPAGNYIVTIASYDMLPFSWAKSDTHGLAYVPTLRAISSVEADDDSNPELQKEQLDALEKFGDWTSRDLRFAYRSKETNTDMAQVAEINFPLIETDADHEEAFGLLEKHAWRFYLNEDGTESGFVADVLGLTFPEGTELGDILEATVGKKFMVHFEYEANQDPNRPPNFVAKSVTSLG